VVVIRNCPPVSALKRFKLEGILKSPEAERDLSHAQKAQDANTATSALALSTKPASIHP